MNPFNKFYGGHPCWVSNRPQANLNTYALLISTSYLCSAPFFNVPVCSNKVILDSRVSSSSDSSPSPCIDKNTHRGGCYGKQEKFLVCVIHVRACDDIIIIDDVIMHSCLHSSVKLLRVRTANLSCTVYGI